MNNVELWTIVWIPVSVALVIGFAFSLGWIEDLVERRKGQGAAE